LNGMAVFSNSTVSLLVFYQPESFHKNTKGCNGVFEKAGH
jgi:hypothetical protein